MSHIGLLAGIFHHFHTALHVFHLSHFLLFYPHVEVTLYILLENG